MMTDSNLIGYGISFLLGFLASILANIPTKVIFDHLKKRKENRPLNQILNFGYDDDLVFVFAHREFVGEASNVILPRTSTEDFMAINNIKSALIKIQWKNKDLIRDTNTIKSRISDQKKNIISICSSKSNSFTKIIEDYLKGKGVKFFYGEFSNKSNEWIVSDGIGEYRTKTFDQLKNYRQSELSQEDIPTKKYEDVAYITKITNPYNSRNKIMIIAGVRGIGTWGAAECIKKEFNQIYTRLPKENKGCDFSALLSVQYDNMDIISIRVDEVLPLSLGER